MISKCSKYLKFILFMEIKWEFWKSQSSLATLIPIPSAQIPAPVAEIPVPVTQSQFLFYTFRTLLKWLLGNCLIACSFIYVFIAFHSINKNIKSNSDIIEPSKIINHHISWWSEKIELNNYKSHALRFFLMSL